MPYKDPDERREYDREWKRSKADIYRRYNRKRSQRLREFTNRVCLRFGCSKCGYKKCARALHFHHIDPATKVARVCQMVSDKLNICLIKKEMRKCVILCSNCHMEEEDAKNK